MILYKIFRQKVQIHSVLCLPFTVELSAAKTDFDGCVCVCVCVCVLVCVRACVRAQDV